MSTQEKPLNLIAPEIKAILEGRKTQLRRVMKPQPVQSLPHTKKMSGGDGTWEMHHPAGWRWRDGFVADEAGGVAELRHNCPFGLPGERFWVREAWGLCAKFDSTDWYRGPMPGTADDILGRGLAVEYKADWASKSEHAFWRSPLVMPRWASRLILQITDVRVERLQATSVLDAIAEGAIDPSNGWDGNVTYPISRFRTLWDECNKNTPWETNPWVWVIYFKK